MKPRESVLAALISTNWNPEDAFMILIQDMMEPTVYKYLIKNSREKQAFKHIESGQGRPTFLLSKIKVTTVRSKKEEKKQS